MLLNICSKKKYVKVLKWILIISVCKGENVKKIG